ncbi:hypothetical protein 049ML003_52 [Bacillus phage 049ML003]|nr:hypothetical protein 049ML003_52 [Bacillus phage 049ML003]
MFEKNIVTKKQAKDLVNFLGNANMGAVRAEVKLKFIEDVVRENIRIDGLTVEDIVNCIIYGFRTISPVEELINDLDAKIKEFRSCANNSITDENRNIWASEADGLKIALTMILERRKELEGKYNG